MAIDKYEYLTVKEAAALTNKSESSIKRFVHENKGQSKYFKFEKLPTGHKKIYINRTFIEQYFNGQKSTTTNKSEPLKEKGRISDNQDFIDYLKKEIDRKNEVLKQKEERIDELTRQQAVSMEKLLDITSQNQHLQMMIASKGSGTVSISASEAEIVNEKPIKKGRILGIFKRKNG